MVAVKAKVALAGISKADFNEEAQDSFKTVTASNTGPYCGASGTRQCTIRDVTITGIIETSTRRGISLEVEFQIRVAETQANTATSALSTKLADTAQFTSDLQAQGGSLATITGAVVTEAPVLDASAAPIVIKDTIQCINAQHVIVQHGGLEEHDMTKLGWTGGSGSCADMSDSAVRSATNGGTCADAVTQDLCNHEQHGALARQLCPVSCNACSEVMAGFTNVPTCQTSNLPWLLGGASPGCAQEMSTATSTVTCTSDGYSSASCVTYWANVRSVPKNTGSNLAFTIAVSGCGTQSTCSALTQRQLSSINGVTNKLPDASEIFLLDSCTACTDNLCNGFVAPNIASSSSSSNSVSASAFIGIGIGGVLLLAAVGFCVQTCFVACGQYGEPAYKLESATEVEL